MVGRLRLVIFDVDGTLIDSQAAILGAMTAAFETVGLEAPGRDAVLSIVGLSLPNAMATLAPEHGEREWQALVDGYRAAHTAQLRHPVPTPLYPGAAAALDRLEAAGILLGIATGKAQRGVGRLLAQEGWEGRFTAIQTADDAPSKPHPGMVENCLALTGVAPEDAVVLGDTEFDMAMARSAGVHALGASWGYHPRDRLLRGGAARILDGFEGLDGALDAVWERV